MSNRILRTRWRRRLLVGALVPLVAVFVAACGSDDDADGNGAADGEPLRVAMLSNCEGPFGAFFEPDIGGGLVPFINRGATAVNADKPSDGVDGAEIAGRPIEFVGFGCSDSTPESALAEARRLVEQENADILIGPLSGDEGIAIAEYAKENPDKTFINGTAGAQDATLKVQAPNFFRYHTDGAQWSAGSGEYAFDELGWRTAVTIGDDYSFPYTSVGGFIAEFCGVGGNVVKRIWPPLGETDYSSFIAQIPEIPGEADGLYVGIGGEDLVRFVRQYNEARGPFEPGTFMGNLFVDDPLVTEEIGDRVLGAITSGETAADSNEDQAEEYVAEVQSAFPELAELAPSVFVYNYYTASEGLIRALEEVDGNTSDVDAFHEALSNVEFDAAYGSITLDENRQAISDNYVKELVQENGEVVVKTIRRIPEVDQQFGGAFTPDTPAPDRTNPECVERDLPWVGNSEEVNFGD